MDYTFILRLPTKAVGVLAAGFSPDDSLLSDQSLQGQGNNVVENRRSTNLSIARIGRSVVTRLPSVLPFEVSLQLHEGSTDMSQ